MSLEQKPATSFDSFAALDIRVGRIVAVEDFPEARKPAYKLEIDFGNLGMKRSSAQITNYEKATLVGRQVIAVVNFPVRKIAGFSSEVLVLGAYNDSGQVILLNSDTAVPLGSVIG